MYLTRFRINTARTEAKRLLGSPQRLHGAVDMAFPEPPARDGAGPRVLWRIDPAPAGRADLLISSPGRPDLNHLVEQAGWPSLGQEGWTTFAYGEFLDTLSTGDVWAFRLTANPVHHIRRQQDPVGSPTKRTAHVTVRHQVGWLLKQQERAGFTVLRRAADTESAPSHVRATDGSNASGLTAGGEEATPAADPSPSKATAGAGEPEEWGYQLIVHNRTPVRFAKRPTEGNGPVPGTDASVRFTRVTFDGRLRITDQAAFHRTLTHGLGKAKAYGCGLMTLVPVQAGTT
ncbi:type I-E CRISPR-associated protein Cas6/Cse3/CasE [Streptomyces phytohabitans]|uniref:type I-E CRISPR-associated protein Cas6/Cse3/CasE n=1 Tax=Streptomyces phytohabitans TaxID=1150371 RepID=UPI00345C3754